MLHIVEYDDEEMMLLVAESVRRLEIRTHLAALIMKEQKRRKELNQPFEIVDDNVWKECRFSRISQLMGEKLKDARLKKVFLDTFKNSY